MKTTMKLLTVLSGGGNVLPSPFTDSFGTDGALSSPWTGATFAVSAGKAFNTPVTFGAEKLADPGLEANYTAGFCDSFAAKGGSPTLAQSADVHGGSKAQEFTATAANDQIRMLATPSVATLGKFYQATQWSKRTAGTSQDTEFQLRSTNWVHSGVKQADASYTQKRTQAQCTTVNSMSFYACFQAVGGTFSTILVDDLSLKEMESSEMFATVNAPNSTVIDMSVKVTTERGVYGGLVCFLDSPSNPLNYVYVYEAFGQMVAYKVVNGTPTQLIAPGNTYVANAPVRIVKSGTTFQFFYNGSQMGADQTVSDAAILAGRYHGLFSSDSRILFDDFSLTHS